MLSGSTIKYFRMHHGIKIRDDEQLMQEADRRQEHTDQFSSTLIPRLSLHPTLHP